MLDTNMFYPATNTLAYSDHLFAQTLQVFPLFLIISNPLLIQNLYLLSTFIIAAFGMYLLVRFLIKENNKVSIAASMLSGFLYSFSYYHIDHLGQVPTASIQWIPLSLLYLLKSYRSMKTKDLALFFIFFSLNCMSTMYYGIFLSLAVIIFIFMKVRSAVWLKKFILVGIPFIIIIVASLYPYLLFHLENPEVKRTLEESSWRSAHLSDYLVRNAPHDRVLYVGIVPMILAFFYLFAKKKHRYWLFFMITALISMILSLGPELYSIRLPYYYLYTYFPIAQSIRVPSRFGIMAIFAFSAVAGLSFYWLISKLTTVRLKVMCGSVIIFLAIFDYSFVPRSYMKVPTIKEAPPVYSWLAKQPENSIILELPLKSGTHSNHIEDQVERAYEEITENDNFVAETFRLYFSTIHWKQMVNGYSSYFPPTYSELATVMEEFPSIASIDYIKNRKITVILVNKNQYGERWNTVHESMNRLPAIKLFKQFENVNVYRIE